ncbi:hypothetical protein AJ88_37190 [Mesorhizobium amorphae CCBAU 01583]|nr:hypothetical protein AJ88_37190 [Mesorhizobium amorphae CCBAU 01583]
MPDFQFTGGLREFFHEALIGSSLNIDPIGCQAVLTGCGKFGCYASSYGCLQGSIIENDKRSIAAELK